MLPALLQYTSDLPVGTQRAPCAFRRCPPSSGAFSRKDAMAPRASSKPPPSTTTTTAAAAVRIVGIGASAGGLDAFLELVSALPAESGMAFVLIQHLDPRHNSLLVAILAGATAIPVQEVVDGMRIERDHIYAIPPGTEMTVEDDVLRLPPPPGPVPAPPLRT